jgi:hypothetical protein
MPVVRTLKRLARPQALAVVFVLYVVSVIYATTRLDYKLREGESYIIVLRNRLPGIISNWSVNTHLFFYNASSSVTSSVRSGSSGNLDLDPNDVKKVMNAKSGLLKSGESTTITTATPTTTLKPTASHVIAGKVPDQVVRTTAVDVTWTEVDRCKQYEVPTLSASELNNITLPAYLTHYSAHHDTTRASLWPLLLWRQRGRVYCNGDMHTYEGEMAKFTGVTLDRTRGVGAKGGEDISDVMMQAEDMEFYTYKQGFFRLPCPAQVPVSNMPLFGGARNDHNLWKASLQLLTDRSGDVTSERRAEFTVAVIRYEYVNLYHTLAEMYSVFLTALFFDLDPANVHVLWVDGHPRGSLDDVWGTLFASANRVSSLRNQTSFDTMVWGIVGPHSPIHCHFTTNAIFVDEFRHFFLSRYNIDGSSHKLDCSRVNVLLVWRRNYVAHPRNPSGSVSRKVANEEDLVIALRDINNDTSMTSSHTSLSVKATQIDLLDMRSQLDIIATTDILIGMHGAGLSHALFLPDHAALVELLPNYWPASEHFAAMARWRHLLYERWQNTDPTNELPDSSTRIPPHVVVDIVKKLLSTMCHATKSSNTITSRPNVL